MDISSASTSAAPGDRRPKRPLKFIRQQPSFSGFDDIDALNTRPQVVSSGFNEEYTGYTYTEPGIGLSPGYTPSGSQEERADVQSNKLASMSRVSKTLAVNETSAIGDPEQASKTSHFSTKFKKIAAIILSYSIPLIAYGLQVVSLTQFAGTVVSVMCDHPATASEPFLDFVAACDPHNNFNYAQYMTGAQPLELLGSPPVHRSRSGMMTVFTRETKARDSAVPLNVSAGGLVPGRCWPFAGRSGSYAFNLSAPINVVNISVSHITAEITTAFRHFFSLDDINVAPRRMRLWASVKKTNPPGLIQAILLFVWQLKQDSFAKSLADRLSKNHQLIPIADMVYDISLAQSTQTFHPHVAYIFSQIKVQTLVLQILENSGRPDKTCLYGVEVYGHV